jgi:drug/metabolite transporter (DMT)-like permease
VVPIVLAFACAVVYGVADYCGGSASRRAPALVVTITGQMASLIVGLVVVLIIGTPLPGGRDMLWGATAGVASAVALSAFYYALSHGSMTVVSPVTAVTSAVIPVVYGLAAGERPGGLAYIGMVVAIVAVALVSGAVGTRHVATRASTILFALLAGLGFAVIFIALGKTHSASGVWPLVSSRLTSVVLLGGFMVVTRRGVRGHMSAWRIAALAGTLDMSANFLYLLAVHRGLLSIVVVVVALYPVSTVVLAFGLDRERVSRSQAIGMALAFGSLVLVSLAGST